MFGFVGEFLPINFRYSVELLRDNTKLIKKLTMSKIARKKLSLDESRIWNLDEPVDGKEINMKTNLRSYLFGYTWYDVHVESTRIC